MGGRTRCSALRMAASRASSGLTGAGQVPKVGDAVHFSERQQREQAVHNRGAGLQAPPVIKLEGHPCRDLRWNSSGC
jgi:hypothetical protein